jgi:hypothetical protein
MPNPQFLAVVKQMLDYIYGDLPLRTPPSRLKCLNRLCTGFVETLGGERVIDLLWGVRTLPENPGLDLAADDPMRHIHLKIWAAVMCRAYSRLDNYLRQACNAGASKAITWLRDSPLTVAIALNDPEMYEIAMKFCRSLAKQDEWNANIYFDTKTALTLALQAGQIDHVRDVAELYADAFGGHKRQYIKVMTLAVSNDDPEYVKAILPLCRSGPKIDINQWKAACRFGNVEIIKTIIQDGDLDVNAGCYATTDPILCTVRIGNLAATKTIVDAGGEMDYGPDASNALSPMGVAMAENHLHVVEYLLKLGSPLPKKVPVVGITRKMLELIEPWRIQADECRARDLRMANFR